MKKALILDLDNTIYPVSSIAGHLFAELFATLNEFADIINQDDDSRLNRIKNEMTRRPFQHIAEEFALPDEVRIKMINTLKNMTYDLPMYPFEDYEHIRNISLDKFLVTTGFSKLQWSKVKMLGIEKDFKEIHIVDPEINHNTKKDVFEAIMHRHSYQPNELLVIGDDPESEIKAAKVLGVDTVLYDIINTYTNERATYKIDSMKDVRNILH
jgi:putative hydrolase of the HAD superfamily